MFDLAVARWFRDPRVVRAAVWTAILLLSLLPFVLTTWRSLAIRNEQLRAMDSVGSKTDAAFDFAAFPPWWASKDYFPGDSVRVSNSTEYWAERGEGWTTIFDRLTDLVLVGAQDSNAAAELADCASLQRVWVNKAVFSPQGWDGLIACRQVEFVMLDRADVAVVDLSLLRNHAKLHQLLIDESNVTDERLGFLKELKALDSLTLRKNPLTGSFFRGRGELAGLDHLAIGDTALDDDGAARIAASCPRLSRLHASPNRGAGRGFASLGLAPRLTFADLRDTAVDDEAAEGIARSTTLQEIMLEQTRVTGKGLLALAKIPSLTHVTIDVHRLDQADVAAFRSKRPDVTIPTGKPPVRRPKVF